MRYTGYSDVGGRANNEDASLIAENEGAYLFAVADGLGGVEAGEVASEIVITTLKQLFLCNTSMFDLTNTIGIANESILDCQESRNKRMKTTIAAVLVQNGLVSCAHVGDSRIYLFNDQGILYQSPDHSVSQMAVYLGEITASGIRSHYDRNKLTRALGVESELKIEYCQFARQDVAAALICSDGFWQYVYEEEMVSLLTLSGSPERWLSEMRKLLELRVRGDNDNNTAVAVIF